MRLTAVIEDNTVLVNGEARTVDLSVVDPNWHAVQWYGAHGTIEVKQGDRVWLDAFDGIAWIYEAWLLAPPPPPAEEPV
jgi:hypothetical protein